MKTCKWTIRSVLLACFCVVFACKTPTVGAAVGKVGAQNITHVNKGSGILEKYKCKAGNHSGISLNCTTASIKYVNVSGIDFQNGLRPNGSLELKSGKFAAKSYSLNDQPRETVKVAVCQNKNETQFEHQNLPQPHQLEEIRQSNETRKSQQQSLEPQPTEEKQEYKNTTLELQHQQLEPQPTEEKQEYKNKTVELQHQPLEPQPTEEKQGYTNVTSEVKQQPQEPRKLEEHKSVNNITLDHQQQPHQNDEHHETPTTRPSFNLRKCCDTETERLVKYRENGLELFRCVNTKKSWNPAIFNTTKDDYSSHVDLDKFSNSSVVTFGFPSLCTRASLKVLYNSEDIWFMILDNGSVEIGLKFWFKPVWLPMQDNNFCLDEVVNHDPPQMFERNMDSHFNYHKNQALLYCPLTNFDDYLLQRRVFGVMCVSAAAIIFILLIIYLAIWDKQNLAGWTQFNIFVALFFVVLLEGLRTLVDANSLQIHSTKACVFVAAVAQYFFFALNTTWSVMCFDLCYMFWKLETASQSVCRYKKRLIGYLIFSWGFPLLVVGIAFTFTHNIMMEQKGRLQGIYAFAHRRCSSPIRHLGFQTQGIMFLGNLGFFILTTFLIWKHRRGISAERKGSSDERQTWRTVRLFLKLVIVMGVASLSVPLDYFFVISEPLSTTAICFRIVHFIPFVAVLFIFGFNQKNMTLISQKYPRAGKYFGFVACISGATANDTLNPPHNSNRTAEANPSRSANRTSDEPSSPPP